MQNLYKHKYLKYKKKYLTEKEILQIGGDIDYTNPIAGNELFKNIVNTNYIINIDEISFMLIYKTNIKKRDIILLKSSKEGNFVDNDKYKFLVFYKSLSELGIFRLGCMMRGQYVKGDIHYVQSTFIDLRLQKYINANLHKLPTENTLTMPVVSYASNIHYHIQSSVRAIKIPGFFQYKSFCGKATYDISQVVNNIQETSNFIKTNYTYANDHVLYKYSGSTDHPSDAGTNYSYIVKSIDLIPKDSNNSEGVLTLSYAIIDFCSYGDKKFTANYSPQITQFQDELGASESHCKYSDFYFPLFVSQQSAPISEYGTHSEYILSTNFICKFMEYYDQCTHDEADRNICDTTKRRYAVVAERFIDIYPFNELANNDLMSLIVNGDDINKFVTDFNTRNVKLDDINSSTGMSPLMYAVKYNNISALQTLLNYGANISYENIYNGKSILMYVQNDTSVEILELLINHKANVNYVNKYSKKSVLTYFLTELDINKAFIEILVKNSSNLIKGIGYEFDNKSPLIYAIKKYLSSDLIKILVEYDKNLDKLYGYDTILSSAIKDHDINTIKLLISKNVNLDLISKNYFSDKFIDETPLLLAIRLNLTGSHLDIIQLLLENKAGLYVLVHDMSPLMYTVHNKSSQKVIELLLQHGANPNYANSSQSILSILINKYVYSETKSNSTDSEGVNILRSFVKSGLDVNAKVNGKSALSILYEKRNYKSASAILIIQFLINSGAVFTFDDIKHVQLSTINDVYNTVLNFPFMNGFITKLIQNLSSSENLITNDHKEIISWLIYHKIPIGKISLTNVKERLYMFPLGVRTISVSGADRKFIYLNRAAISIEIKN